VVAEVALPIGLHKNLTLKGFWVTVWNSSGISIV